MLGECFLSSSIFVLKMRWNRSRVVPFKNWVDFFPLVILELFGSWLKILFYHFYKRYQKLHDTSPVIVTFTLPSPPSLLKLPICTRTQQMRQWENNTSVICQIHLCIGTHTAQPSLLYTISSSWGGFLYIVLWCLETLAVLLCDKCRSFRGISTGKIKRFTQRLQL